MTSRGRTALVVAIAVLLVAMPVAMALGAAGLSADREVLLNIRLPRVLVAALAGAATSVAGALLQSVLRNPLAEPSIIGLAPAAAVGASLASIVSTSAPIPHLGAVVTCAVAVAVLLRVSHGSPLRIIVTGVGLGAVAVACLGIASTVAGRRDLMFWSLGSTSAATLGDAAVLALCLVGVAAVTLPRRTSIDILSLGPAGAAGLGVNARSTSRIVVAACAALVAAAVASTGMIALLGLAVPYYARALGGAAIGSSIALSSAVGSAGLVIADTIARTVASPLELPLGAVVALAAIPAFVAAARKVSA